MKSKGGKKKEEALSLKKTLLLRIRSENKKAWKETTAYLPTNSATLDTPWRAAII